MNNINQVLSLADKATMSDDPELMTWVCRVLVQLRKQGYYDLQEEIDAQNAKMTLIQSELEVRIAKLKALNSELMQLKNFQNLSETGNWDVFFAGLNPCGLGKVI